MVRKVQKKPSKAARKPKMVTVRKSVHEMLKERAMQESNDWRLNENKQHFTFNRVGDEDNLLLDTEKEINLGIQELDDTDLGYDNDHLETYSQGEDMEDAEEEGY